MNFKKNIFTLILFLFLTKIGITQAFPVTSNVVLIPPYSLKLPDYYATGSNNLQVTLLLNDLNVPSYDVKLRLVIRSANAIIATSQGFKPNLPITLQGGVPTILSGSELSEYLDYNNLTFQGISRAQLAQNGGKLPEGIYQFNVEVYDYNLDFSVSNSPKVAAWMLLNEPPFLNQPQQNSKPTALDPQNFLFQWAPRHLGSPNSAFSTEYKFKLVEVWPSTTNANQAILSNIPIYTTTTNATNLVYGPTEIPLVPGRKYAWQVQATDINNLDLFQNQGYSEVFSFTYGDECIAPTNLISEVLNSQKIQLDWTGQWNHSKTQVEIKKYNDPNAPWTSFDAFDNQQIINKLAKGTTFEYRIKGYCGTVTSPYLYDTISTPTQSERDFSCGPPIPDTSLTGNTPLASLYPNDQFEAYDYIIKVTEATKNPDGTFTGKGIVEIPAFERLKFNVKFANITINNEYKLIAGNVVTIYDKANSLFVDLDKLIETLGGYNGKVKDITINYPIDSVEVVKDANGNITGITVHGTNGETNSYTGEINYTFTDSEGNIHTVSEGGNQNTTTASNKDPISKGNTERAGSSAGGKDGIPITTKGLLVEFFKDNDSTIYAFDDPSVDLLQIASQDYEVIKTTDNQDYVVKHKLITAGSNDYVRAKITITDSLYKADSIIFMVCNEELEKTSLNRANSEYRIKLTGAFNNVEQLVYAVIPATDSSKNKVAGKFKLYHVDEKEVNITPTSINNAVVPSNIGEVVNSVFSPLGVVINVNQVQSINVSDTIWDLNQDGEFEYGDISILADYSAEMRALQKEIVSSPSYDKQSYNLIFNSFTVNTDEISGYMPLGRQYGYVFNSEIDNTSQLTKTINHELAHGIFLMRHSFEFYGDNSEGNSNLLMDYDTGQITNNVNWKEIHGKTLKLYQFLDKQERSADILRGLKTKKQNVEKYSCFLNPTGTAIIDFFNNGEYLDIKEAYFNRTGAVNSFTTKNGKEYVALYVAGYGSTKLNKFKGYYDNLITKVPDFRKVSFDVNDYPELKVSYSLANDENLIYAYAQYGNMNLNEDKYYYQDCWTDLEIPYKESAYKTQSFELPPYIIKEKDWSYNRGFIGGDCYFEKTSAFIIKTIKGDKVLSIEEETKLVFLADYLEEKTKGISPMFYNHNDETYTNIGFEMVLKKLGENGIMSIEDFEDVFEFEITPQNSRPFRGAGIIFSSLDLWDGVPNDYNIGSTDFTSFSVGLFNTEDEIIDRGVELLGLLDSINETIPELFHDEINTQVVAFARFKTFANNLINSPNTGGFSRINDLLFLKTIYRHLGLYEPYVYSYSDLVSRKRHLLNGQGLSITYAEEAGAAFPITSSEVYHQYVSKYHTDLFLYFALEEGLLEMALPSVELNNIGRPKLGRFKSHKAKLKFTKERFDGKRAHKKIKARAKNKKSLNKKIKNKQNAKRKYNEMSSSEKELFEKDFGGASKTTITKLDADGGKLIDTWKANKNNPKRNNIKWLEALTDAVESFFKSVDEFALTFDKAGNVSQIIRRQAFDLYKSKNWNDLEDLFIQNNLNGGWPPGNGGFNIVDDVSITAGQKFDRYGGSFGELNGNPMLGGSYTSPINNNTPYSYGERALNGTKNTYDFYYEIEVIKDLPFKAQNADVIPWFGQTGKAKQTMWKIPIDDATGYPKTWNKLAEEGYVKITIKDSPNGKFTHLKGRVISSATTSSNIIGSVTKVGNNVNYTNISGNLLKWTEQGIGDIDNALLSAKNLDPDIPGNPGRIIEAKVGEYVKQQKQLDGYALKIKRANNSIAGDIDVSTVDELIEVKKSFSAWLGKKAQVNKFVNSSMDDFLNPYNKKVILYIDEPLTVVQKSTIINYIPSNVSLVNSLSELQLILK